MERSSQSIYFSRAINPEPPFAKEGSGGLGILPWWKNRLSTKPGLVENVRNRRCLRSEATWWYWMKEKQNQPEIWDEAKKLF